MGLDDKTIMRRVQRGEHELFNQLVSRYRERLYRVASSKLGDPARADDAVQESLLAAFAARHTYDPGFAVSTWLWTILINVCRRELKRFKRRPAEISRSSLNGMFEYTALEPADDRTGLSVLLLAEQRAVVGTLLEELPEAQADALRLRYFGGLQYDEIAETMHSSVSGAKRRVHNGLLALARRLREIDEPREMP